jgi:mono/diheme cytochrome c family protein
MRSVWTRCVALAAVTLAGVSWDVTAQTGRTAADRVYSDAQAQRGQVLYDAQCRACHGATLAGGLGPPLAGADFLRIWDKQPLADLVDKIEHTMPATAPGSLSRTQAADVAAYLLRASGFPAGAAELTGEAALKQIALAAPPGTARSGAPPGPALALSSRRPTGNMAQVMRGVLFPSSNLIFNVQNQDPAERPKIGWEPGTSAFSWVDWGGGIYSGWELVDYAAIALEEAAPLLLVPGRRCENGKPVPVDRADWIKYAQELADAGRAAYKASQTRNQDAIIAATDVITDACLNCHVAYRDKPGGTPEDPSNKAARCE